MLDRDISTADAVRLLSCGDEVLLARPGGLGRRRFLQLVGWGIGGGAALGTLGAAVDPALVPALLRDAWAAPPIGPTDGILVTIFMHGGNDGLNTLVPYGDGAYYSRRATGGVAIAPESVLPIDGRVGLHPNLTFVKSMYDQGNVAIVDGVGYPGGDLSHFSSTAQWMHGSSVGGRPRQDGSAGGSTFSAASTTSSAPRASAARFRST